MRVGVVISGHRRPPGPRFSVGVDQRLGIDLEMGGWYGVDIGRSARLDNR